MDMVMMSAITFLLAGVGLGWLMSRRRARQRMNAFLKARGGKPCPACGQYVSQVALVCRGCAFRFDLKNGEEERV